MNTMNWEKVETNWKEYQASAKNVFSRLSDAELEVVRGRRDKLIDKVRDAYHITQVAAEKEVDNWAKSIEA